MKTYPIILLILLTGSAAFCQNRAEADATVGRFIRYYNADQPDSLYNLFSDNARKQLPLDKMTLIIKQIKMQYGKLVKSTYAGQQNDINGYLITFDGLSNTLLNLAINKTSKVLGVGLAPNNKITLGNVTVKTTTSVLKGTLTVPDGAKNMPVVLLIAGSGPTDRDGNSTLSPQRFDSYKMIADSLKQKNIAVLRYDKRGIGESSTTKSQENTTLNDFVDDACALIEFLKADKRFSKIIIAGHSEGSLIGMVACGREKADAFISLAGAGFSADKILKTQLKKSLSADAGKKAVLIIDSIKVGKTLKQKLEGDLLLMFNASIQPYLHSWMQYDPTREIAKLNAPVLIVQGTNDWNVSITDAQLLKKAKSTARLSLITSMNHELKDTRLEGQSKNTTAVPPLHHDLIPTLTGFINTLK